MPDYGHDLLFGSFLTPRADRPDAVVALTRHSEEVGLDLATFQDHPYQPAFLDTWTLLSHLGALTSRIHLAPNVLNVPLRQPAVLARSAASLDLLTGGRLALGLGAGAFWDAIAAMGVPRLTAGESVRGLAEAVEIIRGVWDAAERRPLRVDGRVHRVDGAKRGPAPAHDVPIWLGAYKDRMLALTGRVADGWLPSLGYLDPADLPHANAVIDDAAREAGRAPEAVRRLLNINGTFASRSTGLLDGPPDQWVEELTDLALEHGISAFVLGGDDARALQVLAEEVAPAVRDAVAAERARPARRDATPSLTTTAAAPTRADDPALERGTAAHAAGPDDAGPHPAELHSAEPYRADPEAAGRARLGVTPTPPPAARLGPEDLLDEASRPTRPPSGADVTYTDEGRATGQHLVDVHDMLRRELEQVRGLVAQVRSGAVGAGAARSTINAMTMRQNAWTVGAYCQSYCRVVTQHHGLEDAAVFPHLAASEPALVPVLERLGAEHHVIHDVLERVDRALVAVVRDAGADGGAADLVALSEAVDALTDTLLSHLAYEEEQLVEPLARHGFYAAGL